VNLKNAESNSILREVTDEADADEAPLSFVTIYYDTEEDEEESDLNVLRRVIYNGFCGAAACPGTLFGECMPMSKDDIDKSYGGDDSSFQSDISNLEVISVGSFEKQGDTVSTGTDVSDESLLSYSNNQTNDRKVISNRRRVVSNERRNDYSYISSVDERTNDRSMISSVNQYTNVASFISHTEESIHDRDHVSSFNERTYECNSNSYSNNYTSSQPTSLGLNTLVGSPSPPLTKRRPLSSFRLDDMSTHVSSIVSLNRAVSKDVSTLFGDLQSNLLQPSPEAVPAKEDADFNCEESTVFDGLLSDNSVDENQDIDNHSIEIVAAIDRVSKRILASKKVELQITDSNADASITSLNPASQLNNVSMHPQGNISAEKSTANEKTSKSVHFHSSNEAFIPESTEIPIAKRNELSANKQLSMHSTRNSTSTPVLSKMKRRDTSRDELNTPTTSCSSCSSDSANEKSVRADNVSVLNCASDEKFFFHSISPCNSMIEVGLSPETNYRSINAPHQAFRSPTSSMNVEDILSHGEANSSILTKSNNKSQTKMSRLKNGIVKKFRCKAKTAFI